MSQTPVSEPVRPPRVPLLRRFTVVLLAAVGVMAAGCPDVTPQPSACSLDGLGPIMKNGFPAYFAATTGVTFALNRDVCSFAVAALMADRCADSDRQR